MVENFLDKIYAGFLGMNVGIRLGAPVEPVPWDTDRIRDIYGEITGYVKEYRNFAADDDVNGPVYFLRGLTDHGVGSRLTPEMVGRAWLNYTRNGIGMFWWGGYGISTEHTAYRNLKQGIPAPASGSIGQNGTELAEQIGGQIFIDTWGFIWPGRPEKAADYARTAASVSHDGNGLHGAAFMAACIAAAYTAESVDEILDAGLAQIPPGCIYAEVVWAVRNFHREHPGDFRECMQYLTENWGYDKYGGVCHIIPNAGVCILAILYGGGDFNRTIEIAAMCGWDTDCNAGNVGSILGVFTGLSGIREAYRKPVNDVVITSGISGYLNILDVPSYVKDLAACAYLLAGEELPAEIVRPRDGELLFDFELPGSTHGMRLSDEIRFLKRHSHKGSLSGKGSLEILIDRILPEDSCHVYYKPFYRRKDFHDERYKPVFSPQVFSGQLFKAQVCLELWLQGEILAAPYVRTAMREEYLYGEALRLIPGEWTALEFTIPDTCGDEIAEIGFLISTPEGTKDRVFGHIFLDHISVTGAASYSIDMAVQKKEFAQITPFSLNQCQGEIRDGSLFITSEEDCQAFTGNYYIRDMAVEADITVLEGERKGLVLRAGGAECFYSLGFGKKGEAQIACHYYGERILKKVSYAWEFDILYTIRAECSGEWLRLFINGEEVAAVKDTTHQYGMTGYFQGPGSFRTGRMSVETAACSKKERIRL